MQTEQLIQTVVTRTGLPYDEVRLILETVRNIVRDQLGIYESVVLPGMMKISAKRVNGRWKAHIALYRDVAEAVGSGATLILPEIENP